MYTHSIIHPYGRNLLSNLLFPPWNRAYPAGVCHPDTGKTLSAAKPEGTYFMAFLVVMVVTITAFTFTTAQAQRYRLVNSEISFFSSAPLEDIEAHNSKAQSIFDAKTGEIAFIIPIKGFQFAKSLMQEHFNENFMESDKYPTAKFEGELSGVYPEMIGKQKATAKGKLTIHGVTHEVEIPGEVNIRPDQITMNAKFPIKVADYNIEIPRVVFYNIAEEVEVTVNFTYETDPQQ